MNDIIEQETASEVHASEGNQQDSVTVVPAKAKGSPGRPRTKLTKEMVFLVAADGTMKRRTKGKPAHDSKALVYSVPWDYAGDTLPEDSRFLRNAEIKDTRKSKVAVEAEAAVTVIPTVAEILPVL